VQVIKTACTWVLGTIKSLASALVQKLPISLSGVSHSLAMNSVPTNNSSLPDSHPFSPHQDKLQDNEGPTHLYSSPSHNLQDFFRGDSRHGVVPPRHIPRSTRAHHHKHLALRHLIKHRPRRQIMPGAMQQKYIQVSNYDSLPQATILPPFDSQLTIDSDGSHFLLNHHPPHITSYKAPQHTSLQPPFTFQLIPGISEDVQTFSMHPYPSAPLPDAPSSSVFDTGVQPSLSSAAAQSMAIPVPITSGMGPSSSSSSLPFTSANAAPPTSGPSTDGALVPIVGLWDHADTVPMSQPTRAEPEPGPPSGSHCPCCKQRRRVHPLVRVDNAVEWVREDVMKMTLLFNWSPNAEAEAHESWEPRDM